MADKYRSFAELAAAETPRSYEVRTRYSGATLILAPHGGGIEPGTSELAQAIAGGDHSLYLFEGMKQRNNRDLHITSTNFDERECMTALHRSERVVAIHGEDSERDIVFIGGRDAGLKARTATELRTAGFNAQGVDRPHLAGEAPGNICNRGRSGAGVQLEIAAGLRASFFRHLSPRSEREHQTEAFRRFVDAVRAGIAT